MEEVMESKYFKPKSLTWWSGFAGIACGIFMAAEPIHGLSAIVETLEAATQFTAYNMIHAGLALIGLRGAMQ